MNATNLSSTLARKARRLALLVLFVVAIAVPIRECVAAPYRVATDSLAPELPQGSLVLVYRLASHFEGRSGALLRASRDGQAFEIAREALVGKVVAATR